ncbi:MAG: copper chaperone PCu(A)C [Gammaproteobacteria bacterium]
MNRHLLTAAALALLGPLWILSAHAEPLTVSGAWVREGPPTTQVLAAYMQIDNPGTQDLALIGVSSPQFDSVEIHQTRVVDGLARMLPQERLAIPAGGGVTLEPGGLHMMLIQARHPLSAGDRVMLQLRLEDGTQVPVDAEVRRDAVAAPEHDHSQHHHH